jgi:hypothetical protein
MVKGRLASGFCSPALTCAQTAADAKVYSNAAFANFIEISPFYHFGIGIDTALPVPRSATQIVSPAGSTAVGVLSPSLITVTLALSTLTVIVGSEPQPARSRFLVASNGAHVPLGRLTSD